LFTGAARHLAAFCGLRTCDQTIRAVCHAEVSCLADWLHADKAAGAGFAAAAGDVEFQADGTMVNTWEGWREMRLGAFAKRPRGRPATADEWDTRRLPPPRSLGGPTARRCVRPSSSCGGRPRRAAASCLPAGG
jgi:hypothetical protein